MSNYCSLFNDIIGRYDLIGLISKEHINEFCYELEIINFFLSELYDISTNENYDKNQSIYLITKIKDPNGNHLFLKEDAKKIYSKLNKLNIPPSNLSGGFSNNPKNIKLTSEDIPNIMDDIFKDKINNDSSSNSNSLQKKSYIPDNITLSNNKSNILNDSIIDEHPESQLNNKKLVSKTSKVKSNINSKSFLISDTRNSNSDSNLKSSTPKTQVKTSKVHSELTSKPLSQSYDNSLEKTNNKKKDPLQGKPESNHSIKNKNSLLKENANIENIEQKKEYIKKEKNRLNKLAKNLLKNEKKIYKHQNEKMKKIEKELNERRDHLNKIGNDMKKSKKMIDVLKVHSKTQDNLSSGQKEVVKDDMDMIEMLLICLSILPVAGWSFDFPLFIYAVIKKRYALAIITVLNWYIWGFWLIFGLNINFGPAMKISYIANKQNVVKHSLLKGVSNSNKQVDPYKDVFIKNIDGNQYVVDKENKVYNPIIKEPKVIGVLDKKKNKIVKPTDPEFFNVIEKNRSK